MSTKPANEARAEQFDKGNCVPSQPHLFWWTCRLCGTSTAGEGPPTNHVCSNPNGCKAAPADAGDAMEQYKPSFEQMSANLDWASAEIGRLKGELAAARRLLDAPPVPTSVVAAYTECMEIIKPRLKADSQLNDVYWQIEAARARVIVGMQKGDAPVARLDGEPWRAIRLCAESDGVACLNLSAAECRTIIKALDAPPGVGERMREALEFYGSEATYQFSDRADMPPSMPILKDAGTRAREALAAPAPAEPPPATNAEPSFIAYSQPGAHGPDDPTCPAKLGGVCWIEMHNDRVAPAPAEPERAKAGEWISVKERLPKRDHDGSEWVMRWNGQIRPSSDGCGEMTPASTPDSTAAASSAAVGSVATGEGGR